MSEDSPKDINLEALARVGVVRFPGLTFIAVSEDINLNEIGLDLGELASRDKFSLAPNLSYKYDPIREGTEVYLMSDAQIKHFSARVRKNPRWLRQTKPAVNCA